MYASPSETTCDGAKRQADIQLACFSGLMIIDHELSAPQSVHVHIIISYSTFTVHFIYNYFAY